MKKLNRTEKPLTSNVLNSGEKQIVFSPKSKELTQREYDAFVGLSLFLKAIKNPEDSDNYTHPDRFCFKSDDLFSGLYNFSTGRFKCDHGLSNLQMVYRDAINKYPHSAEGLFYEYSEIMQLLFAIYNAEPIIDTCALAFDELAGKSWFFKINESATDNQPSV